MAAEMAERVQAAGAAGLAITNEGSSPLARAAQPTLRLDAGAEPAVPERNTVTATMTFAIVAAAPGRRSRSGRRPASPRRASPPPTCATGRSRSSSPASRCSPCAPPVRRAPTSPSSSTTCAGAARRSRSCPTRTTRRWPLPRGVPEALAPIVPVVRARQLALALARRRGLDPDAPGGLTKVTVT
jgi:glucosamine 6-phosphate synthetase-like amidotransferase/phosphosugar isomerase protein